MGRALKQVQALPQAEAKLLLPADPTEPLGPLEPAAGQEG
jgi:hypothetical protein